MAWSPDGTRLAVRSRSDDRDEFAVVNVDGRGARTVKRRPAQGPRGLCPGDGPTWSPDGQTLAFASGIQRGSELYVVNADGSGLRRLTRNRAHDHGPVWSPDGRKLAFVTDRSGHPETHVINPDGTGQARLTRSDGGVWSPDGRRFAFARDGFVYVVNADGGGERRLTRIPRRGTKKAFDHVTSWSPDGRYLAFASGNTSPPMGFLDGYVMRADGSGRWRLPWGFAPTWSPDGRTILLVRQMGSPSEIFAVSPDGGGLRNLSRNPTLDGSPAWSPDGRTVAFVSRRDGRYGIFVMNPDGSGQRRLIGTDR
jgi:TolB protein